MGRWLSPSPSSRTPTSTQSLRQASCHLLHHASGPCKLLPPFWRRMDTRSSPCLHILIFNLDTHLVWHSDPPSPLRGLQIGSQLMTNSCTTRVFPTHLPIIDQRKISLVVIGSSPIRWCESNDPGVTSGLFALRLPRFLTKLCAWFYRHIIRDEVYASLVEGWSVKNIQEIYDLVGQRDDYRAEWFEYWQKEKLDLVLTVPNAFPAIRHGDSRRTWTACGYTFLFNIVGVMFPCSQPSTLYAYISDFFFLWSYCSSTTPLALCPLRAWTTCSINSRVRSGHGTRSRRMLMLAITPTRCTVCLWACRSLEDVSRKRRFLRV